MKMQLRESSFEAWTKVYTLLATTMKDAARQASQAAIAEPGILFLIEDICGVDPGGMQGLFHLLP